VIYITVGAILFPFMMILLRGEKKFKRAKFFKKTWAKAICVMGFIKVDIDYQAQFPKDGPYVVCANHASYLDIILMFLIIPGEFMFLGKSDVLKWPIMNVFFKRGIDIPVYRDSVKRAKECIDLAEKGIEAGRIIAIFPEGGMQNNGGLIRFKNGAFVLAQKKNVPIVPLTFLNNWKMFSDHLDFFGAARPGVAKIIVHPTIESTGKDLVSLREETHEVILKALTDYEHRRQNS
jgi:1-acyl-sn-glycerol-3-phosphate acyltransferase